nr:GAF and ANTAR domain-containing protein [Motilibacter deserti]
MTEETVQTALRLVTSLAVEAVPGASGCGVSLMGARGERSSWAATDEFVEQADAVQYELDEGPCLAAWAGRMLVRVDDTAGEGRWPRWAGRAVQLGLQSSLSAPLVAGDQGLGALKVYAREPKAFDAHAERMLVLFSAQAAILVANMQAYDSAQRLSEQLKEALRTRDVIGQAKGVLIAARGVDEETAFALLAATSQRENRKLHDVARALVETYTRRRR